MGSQRRCGTIAFEGCAHHPDPADADVKSLLGALESLIEAIDRLEKGSMGTLGGVGGLLAQLLVTFSSNIEVVQKLAEAFEDLTNHLNHATRDVKVSHLC